MRTEDLILYGGVALLGYMILNKNSNGSFGQGVGNAIGTGIVTTTKDLASSIIDTTKGISETEVMPQTTVGTVVLPQIQIYDLLNPFTYTFKQARAFYNSLW